MEKKKNPELYLHGAKSLKYKKGRVNVSITRPSAAAGVFASDVFHFVQECRLPSFCSAPCLHTMIFEE